MVIYLLFLGPVYVTCDFFALGHVTCVFTGTCACYLSFLHLGMSVVCLLELVYVNCTFCAWACQLCVYMCILHMVFDSVLRLLFCVDLSLLFDVFTCDIWFASGVFLLLVE